MNPAQILGIIPARGGSKGIPRKNIRLLAGRPLIAWTIEAARQASSLGRVIVSTDDAEIAEVARREGAEVPFLRPAALATDTASSIGAVHHALGWFERHEGWRPEAVVFLPPTSPLRTAAQIDATVARLRQGGCDSAVTVTRAPAHPYFIFRREEDGRLAELIEMENKPLRRQDLPPYYTHSQAVIASRTSYLAACGDAAPVFNFRSMAGVEIDAESALDIDGPLDLCIAEACLALRRDAEALVA